MEFKKFHFERFRSQPYWCGVKTAIQHVVNGDGFTRGSYVDAILAVFARAVCRRISGREDLYPAVGRDGDSRLINFAIEKMGGIGTIAAVNSVSRFVLESGKTYVITHDFFEKFKQVSLDSICVKHLPTRFSGYIHFPYPITRPKFSNAGIAEEIRNSPLNQPCTERLSGLYVSLSPIEELTEACDAGGRDFDCRNVAGVRSLSLLFIGENGYMGASVYLQVLPNTDDMAISELLSLLVKDHNSTAHFLTRLCINLMVYINSGNPDLREFRNKITYRSPASTKPVRSCTDLSAEAIYLVGYGWKKETIINYDAKSWEREGHFRWQPHGPGLTLRKLIWLDEITCQRRTTLSIRGSK